jgi:hypothetical protein
VPTQFLGIDVVRADDLEILQDRPGLISRVDGARLCQKLAQLPGPGSFPARPDADAREDLDELRPRAKPARLDQFDRALRTIDGNELAKSEDHLPRKHLVTIAFAPAAHGFAPQLACTQRGTPTFAILVGFCEPRLLRMVGPNTTHG